MEIIKVRQHFIVYHQNNPFLNICDRRTALSGEKSLFFTKLTGVIRKKLSISHNKPKK
jgi:hypothetical protein